MADISDVLLALRDAAGAALYPEGTTKPGAVSAPVRVYVAWPDASLDADLAKGVCNISLWPRGTLARLPHKLDGWKTRSQEPVALTAVVAGEIVTLGGSPSANIIVTAWIDGQGFSVTPTAADTTDTLAAKLALLISQTRGASAAGPVITVPNARVIRLSAAGNGTERREIQRVRQGVQVVTWAPNPALRDALGKLLLPAFMRAPSVPLPDGTSAFLSLEGETFHEEPRKQPLYRRDLLLGAEYAITETRDAFGITGVAIDTGLTPDLRQIPPIIRTILVT